MPASRVNPKGVYDHTAPGALYPDSVRRRSLPAIGHFVADEAGKLLGNEAANAVTGSDDNSR